MLDQDNKENIRGDNTSENSELTQDESNLLTWYREVPEADRGYILRIAQSLAAL
ncbi:hypothetical protein [Pseudomonas mandelii]|uniref:hypothetical protein n=1 Tax=Pseudomonas mandelii TaxID=75612 RepID=UPI003C77255C